MCHKSEAIDILSPVSEDRIISRRYVVWPPRSLRFDTVGLVFVGCRQRKVLRRQARDN